MLLTTKFSWYPFLQTRRSEARRRFHQMQTVNLAVRPQCEQTLKSIYLEIYEGKISFSGSLDSNTDHLGELSVDETEYQRIHETRKPDRRFDCCKGSQWKDDSFKDIETEAQE